MERKDIHLLVSKEEHKRIKMLATELDMSIKDLLLRGAEKVKEEELNSSAEEAKEE